MSGRELGLRSSPLVRLKYTYWHNETLHLLRSCLLRPALAGSNFLGERSDQRTEAREASVRI